MPAGDYTLEVIAAGIAFLEQGPGTDALKLKITH